MAQNIITAGDATSAALTSQGGNDGTLVLVVGPNGGKLNALSFDAIAKGTLLKTPVFTDAPCFSAYQSIAQSLATNTLTKLQFQTKEFDTTAAFDATTNYRFQPLVAGYYQISGGFNIITTVTILILHLYKNGAIFKTIQNTPSNGSGAVYGSVLLFLNGSTDYIELFASQAAAAQNTNPASTSTYFQAVLVRAS